MQEKFLHNANKKLSWLQAIETARFKIERHTRRIRALRKAIKIFEKNIELGEPWPGSEKEGRPK